MSSLTPLYPWLSPVYQSWHATLASGQLASATLIQAAEGLGAESLVESMARSIICASRDSQPCGFCHSCALLQAGHHPDLHYVRPEKPGKAISVDQIRHINRIAQESSQLAGYRLIVIDPADAMNESAANALLKTLEEPPLHCLFILVTSRIQQLLPTIISRCQRWVIPSPTPDVVQEWLQAQAIDAPGYALHLCSDSPLKTQAFMQQGAIAKYRELEALFIAAVNGDVNAQLKFISLINNDLNQGLYWVWCWLTDAQKIQFGVQQSDATPLSAELANRLTYHQLYTQTAALQALIDHLRQFTGLNSELLLLQWFYQWINEEICL